MESPGKMTAEMKSLGKPFTALYTGHTLISGKLYKCRPIIPLLKKHFFIWQLSSPSVFLHGDYSFNLELLLKYSFWHFSFSNVLKTDIMRHICLVLHNFSHIFNLGSWRALVSRTSPLGWCLWSKLHLYQLHQLCVSVLCPTGHVLWQQPLETATTANYWWKICVREWIKHVCKLKLFLLVDSLNFLVHWK